MSSLKRHIDELCTIGDSTSKNRKVDLVSSTTENEFPSAAPSISSAAEPSTSTGSWTSSGPSTSGQSSSVRCEDFPQLMQTAFKKRIESYTVDNEKQHADLNSFFTSIKNEVIGLLHEKLKVHSMMKVNMELFGNYIMQFEQNQGATSIKSFNTDNEVIGSSADLSETFETFVDQMMNGTSEFEERGSGWSLKHIMYIEVNINKFCCFGGSSYIKLPKWIENKKAVVNVKNKDERCFIWAVLSALYPASKSSRVSSYLRYSEVLNTEGMDFPVKFKDISKFESKNNISINVFGFNDDQTIEPMYYSQRKLEKHVDLLLITNGCDKSHYCWIKNLSRLVSSQISRNEHRKYFCDGCLRYFGKEQLLSSHQKNDCNHISTKVPSTETRIDKSGAIVPQNILKFENYEKQLEVPFVVYADFESILTPIDSCQPSPESAYTYRTYRHEPHSFAYIIKCSFDDSVSKFELYRGPDAAEVFVRRIESDIRDIYDKYLKHKLPMDDLSEVEELEFHQAIKCGICQKDFLEDDKVRDHCHLTGKFRFAAHSICNLHYKVPNFVPIIFHNMSGYDSHMFIKQLFSDKSKVDVIAQSKEKYISFSKHLHVDNYVDKNGKSRKIHLILRFIDSFRFMASSLESLGENLRPDLFFETKKFFPDELKFRLMRQKGVFPYNFVDSLEKLNSGTLPSKDDFYDKLNDEHVTDANYDRAKEVWKAFDCHTLGEYSDVYLKSDVLLLCDVFQNFRRICLQRYKLDPAQYFTAPGLSWDAMLKFTGVNLELLTDIDMIYMVKNGIRGGISQCCERKHVANNKFLPNYNLKEPSSFITYLDATNLYGHSMSQLLPIGGFAWLDKNDVENFDIAQIQDDSPKGYILEVDVRYPEELHNRHSDFPFLTENIVPPNSKSKLKKLIPNLNDKFKYVVHYKNLQQAIKNGLVLTKIHRVLKFDQSRWLKKYIDLNTEMRNKAKNNFEKDFYKLMNNTVFGKTMENVEKWKDIRLSTHWENIGNKLGSSTLIARPNFKSCSIFSENLVAVHLGKTSVFYNKPIYVGFCILELSKTVIYEFFYDVIKKKFGNEASLLYTDTDSLILKIYTDNFYNFIIENADKFDTSNYKPDNEFNVPVGPSLLGKMKDEFPADPIVCFYGTGAKSYYVQSLANELKKAKGVKKSVTMKEINLDDYRKIVENGGVLYRKMNIFKTHKHDMYTEAKNRVALSHDDDKRFLIPNTTKTLAWGHVDVPLYQRRPATNLDYS